MNLTCQAYSRLQPGDGTRCSRPATHIYNPYEGSYKLLCANHAKLQNETILNGAFGRWIFEIDTPMGRKMVTKAAVQRLKG